MNPLLLFEITATSQAGNRFGELSIVAEDKFLLLAKRKDRQTRAQLPKCAYNAIAPTVSFESTTSFRMSTIIGVLSISNLTKRLGTCVVPIL